MTTQTDDTRRILDMLSQGKITVDEADRLLKAIERRPAGRDAPPQTPRPTDGQRLRWFRINIHKPANDETHKPKDVNIRVPIAVVKGGMRLGAIIGDVRRRKSRAADEGAGPRHRPGEDQQRSLADERPGIRRVPETLNDTNIEIDDGKVAGADYGGVRSRGRGRRRSLCTRGDERRRSDENSVAVRGITLLAAAPAQFADGRRAVNADPAKKPSRMTGCVGGGAEREADHTEPGADHPGHTSPAAGIRHRHPFCLRVGSRN